jgi:hypothetical protein
MRIDCRLERTRAESSGFEPVAVAYVFDVLDRDGNEIAAYHWYPGGVSRVTTPHMHMSKRLAPLELGHGEAPLIMSDLHFPTNHVYLRDVVRFLIEELGVQPIREEWHDILLADERAESAG